METQSKLGLKVRTDNLVHNILSYQMSSRFADFSPEAFQQLNSLSRLAWVFVKFLFTFQQHASVLWAWSLA